MERLTEKFKDGRNILRKGIADIFNIGFGRFFEGEAVDKLSEYEDLEEQGKLLKLLCVRGDTVWFIKSAFSISKYPIEATVAGMRGAEGTDVIYSAITKSKGLERRFKNSDIGKIAFLTKEEAEVAITKEKQKRLNDRKE